MAWDRAIDHHDDLYPTRLDAPHPIFERRDPTVHAGPPWRAARNGPLDTAQLRRFERDGFLIFENYFDARQIASFTETIGELASDAEMLGRRRTIREPGSDEVRSIFAVHEVSERFRRLVRDPRLLDVARQVLASDVYVHQSRINYKPGFRGKGFNWHSDFETWHAEDGMPRMRAVSFSILATANDDFNGPLMLIPGSHRWFVPCIGRTPEDNYKQSLRDQTLGVPDAGSLTRLIEAGGITAATGGPGTVIMFECNTLHASNANLSPRPRSNLFFVYNSVDNRLVEPYAAPAPRPGFLGERRDTTALAPIRLAS